MDMINDFVSFCKELGIVFNIAVVLVIFVFTALIFNHIEGTRGYAEKHRVYIPFIIGILAQILFDASHSTVAISSIWDGVMATVIAVLVHFPLMAGIKKIGMKF